MPEEQTVLESAPSIEERISAAESQRNGEPTPEPSREVIAPDGEPAESETPEEPHAEPDEPAEAAEPADGAESPRGPVTLSAEEAEGMLARMESLESMIEQYRNGGGAPAPVAAPENADALAAQAEKVQAVQQIPEWQPLTEEEADSIGILNAEAYTAREQMLAISTLRGVEQHFAPIVQQISQAVTEANDRAEVATLTYFILKEHPELEEITPQLRDEVKRARIANPNAAPSKIREEAYKATSKHLAGFNALKSLRGVQKVNAGKPVASSPGTARPVAQTNRPLTIQDRLKAAAERAGLQM
jgi:hypothetical protein